MQLSLRNWRAGKASMKRWRGGGGLHVRLRGMQAEASGGAGLMDGGDGMILLGSKADFTCKAGAFYG